jgi:NAD(P)H-dependent flavin oxidoreductase YrpB (nitropropane dioxygenase family)
MATTRNQAKRERKPRVRTPQQIKAQKARDVADAAEAKFAETHSSKDEAIAIEARNIAQFETKKARRENFERNFGTRTTVAVNAMRAMVKMAENRRKYLLDESDVPVIMNALSAAKDELLEALEQATTRREAPVKRAGGISFAPLPIDPPETPHTDNLSLLETKE